MRTLSYPMTLISLAPTKTTPTDDSQCVSLLEEPSLQHKVFLADSSRYAERLADYYSKNAALAPTCMVLPTSTADVALIASTIYENQCHFGIRSGGHSAHAGSNSVSEGVTIDFGRLPSLPNTKLKAPADVSSLWSYRVHEHHDIHARCRFRHHPYWLDLGPGLRDTRSFWGVCGWRPSVTRRRRRLHYWRGLFIPRQCRWLGLRYRPEL